MFSAILESKLDSVPELNSVTSPTTITTATTTTTTTASATTAESSPAGAPGAPGTPGTPAGAPGAAVEVPASQDRDAPPAEEELQVVEKRINNIVTNSCQGESENCG